MGVLEGEDQKEFNRNVIEKKEENNNKDFIID